jgi:NACalpha-BTF3-like transcription factor
MTAADEAKQLDSVTDRVAETELDSSRANQALGALATAKKEAAQSITVKKEDVDVIMAELECSEGDAVVALRNALEVDGTLSGDELVSAALTRLVVS